MIRLFYNNRLAFKTYDYFEAYKFILDYEDYDIRIVKGFEVLSNDDFCRLFLNETDNYNDYVILELALNKTRSIFNYVKSIKTL